MLWTVAPRLDTARPGVRAAGLTGAALGAVTALAFLPALGNGFVDWDDTRNLALVRARRVLGEPARARAELEVLRRLHPELAGLAGPEGESS